MDIVAATEAGRIVGTSGGRAFTWSSGVFTKILPAGATESEATKVNAAGRIIGSFRDSNNKKRAFTWAEGTLTELNPSGAQETLVSDINASGRVVGTYVDSVGHRRAFTWFEGVYTDLIPDSSEAGEFIAINDSGRVVLNTGQASALWAADPSDVPVVTPTPTVSAARAHSRRPKARINGASPPSSNPVKTRLQSLSRGRAEKQNLSILPSRELTRGKAGTVRENA